MGRRGPKPKPTALRILQGNPSKRALPKDEPTLAPPKSTDPPKGLIGAGLDEWRRLIGELTETGVLTVGDLTVFEEYCRTLTELRQYEAEADEMKPAIAIQSGVQGMVVKLRGQLKQYMAELGLTPSSRSGVKKSDGQEKKGALARFLSGA